MYYYKGKQQTKRDKHRVIISISSSIDTENNNNRSYKTVTSVNSNNDEVLMTSVRGHMSNQQENVQSVRENLHPNSRETFSQPGSYPRDQTQFKSFISHDVLGFLREATTWKQPEGL